MRMARRFINFHVESVVMVLESLIDPLSAQRKPWLMVVYGFLYVSVALFLSLWIFRQYASLVMVFLTVIACIPLMYNTLRYEEHKDIESTSEVALLREHGRSLKFFMYLFLGFVLAFVFYYLVLPIGYTNDLYSIQTATIQSINGNATVVTGNAMSSFDIFSRIFFNNLKVMLFCLLFSFFYGTGALFILVWNASVIGAFIGAFIRMNMAEYALSAGLTKVAAYLHVTFAGFAKIVVHGVPEVLAYFVAGLAGGIISEAIVNHDINTKNFEKIVLDTADLILIAIGLLVLAGLAEIWISPLIY
jgi:uncharacterized membrane protein SpoIIM required for sporulation